MPEPFPVYGRRPSAGASLVMAVALLSACASAPTRTDGGAPTGPARGANEAPVGPGADPSVARSVPARPAAARPGAAMPSVVSGESSSTDVAVADSSAANRAAGSQRGGAYYLDDGPGQDDAARLAELASRPALEPRDEPLHPRANRPYKALGNDYVPMTRREPYRQQGIASWYGSRYHGRPTSIGERYDMYEMTAAHPTLPLPSYVRVTHVENGRSVVVRVNDRGPFLRDRLIDLSYAAAHRLGYVNAGHAPVVVEVLMPSAGTATAAAPVPQPMPAPRNVATQARATDNPGHFLQLGAFRLRHGAEQTLGEMRAAPEFQGRELAVIEDNGFYRVKAGPWTDRDQAQAVASAVQARIGVRPMLVERR